LFNHFKGDKAMKKETFKGKLTGIEENDIVFTGTKKSGIYCEVLSDTALITVEFHKNGDTFIKTKSLNAGRLPIVSVNGKDAINRLHP
jgi:hypothetical protein